MNLFYKNEGSVTVLLSLILIPVILFACIAVDITRVNGAKAIIDSSMDLSTNTALACFDQVLYDAYGLLAMSSDTEELSNNLVKYYENTINSLNLGISEDDSYTQSIIANIKGMFIKEPDFKENNLIDLNCIDFSAGGLPNSQIYQSEIAKKQIVEYMKYRGPVSIGQNLIDKIKVFKDLPQQQKVVEAKSDYDIELTDMQEKCEETYDALLEYKKAENEVSKYRVTDFVADAKCGANGNMGLLDINKLMFCVYKNDYLVYGEEYEKKSVTESYEQIESYVNSNANKIVSELRKYANKTSADDIVNYYFSIVSQLDGIKTLRVYDKVVAKKFSDYRDKIIQEYEENEEKRRKAMGKNYVPLPNTELTNAENSYDSMKSVLDSALREIKNHTKALDNKNKNIKNTVDDNIKELSSYLSEKYKKIDNACKKLDDATVKLQDIINNAIPELNSKAEGWKKQIEALPNGDQKQTLLMQYNNLAKCLKQDEINKLINELNNNKQYFELFKKKLESIKYCEQIVCSEKLSGATKKIEGKIASNSTQNMTVIKDLAFDNFDELFFVPNTDDLDKMALHDIEKEPFYKFLKKSCTKPETSSAEVLEEQASNSKKTVINKVNEAVENYSNVSKQTEGISGKSFTDDKAIYDDLATVLLEGLSSVDDGSKANTDAIDEDTDIGDKKESKKLAKQQKKDTAAGVSAVGGLDGILSMMKDTGELARDNLYITEYLGEMFSCFSTNKNSDDTETTLNGIELSQDNNYLYGSELEYILWGNKDSVSQNVVNTAASIYAIRLAFNTFYAYTDAEIKLWTTGVAAALAGWTGFGAPIVQAVLIFLISMGETALDLVKLMNGQDVVIVKTSCTWVLKPSGIINETVTELSKKVVSSCIDKLTEKIIDVSENFCDEKMDELNTAFDDYSNQLADEISGSITNTLIAPIQAKIEVLITEDLANPADDMFDDLDNIYSDLRTSIENEPNSLSKTVKLIALEKFVNTKLGQIKSEINGAIQSCKDDVASFRSKTETIISDNIKSICAEVKSVVLNQEEYEKLKEEAKTKIRSASGDVKEKATAAIDEFTEKVSASAPSATAGATKAGSKFSALTLNYKEYIKIMLMCGICAGKDNKYVARMCDLIKLNLVKSNNAPEKDFMLSNSFTFVQVNSKTSVRTTFLTSNFLSSPAADNMYYIKCRKILGY